MRVVGYAYPWDFVGDDGAAARYETLGLDGVVLAATYHAVRHATPLHPTRRVTTVPATATYVAFRPEVWRDRRLTPRAPIPAFANAFRDAAAALATCGLSSQAWLVLNHVDALEPSLEDLCVVNAFGDRYPYALCPSFDEVRAYGTTLVAEAVRDDHVTGVVLEAVGPYGLEHHDGHDKVELATWSRVTRDLLSSCWCVACRRRMTAAGLEPDHVAALTRAGVDARATSRDEVFGPDARRALEEARQRVVDAYLAELIDAARGVKPDATITVHGVADAHATGSFAPLRRESVDADVAVVANCWRVEEGLDQLSALRRALGDETTLGAYLRLDHQRSRLIDAEEHLSELRSSGADELHLYHLGALDHHGLDETRRFVESTIRN